MMKRILLMALIIGVTAEAAISQSIADVKSYVYYGKTTSAKDALNKMLQSDASNAEAIYWLGQVQLKDDDIAAAKATYDNAIAGGNQSPLLKVGRGHVYLLEGNNTAARQLFDEAIAASTKRKKEDPMILNAVGRANADGPSTVGDPAYAIQQLQRAAELNPSDPETFVNIGINYLKMGNDKGGDAYEAYMNALKIDPNYAAAKYRLGKIFLSQSNKEKFESYFIGATESDPKYAPAYLDLYTYYAPRDVNKAKDYIEKYMANSDKDCNVDFFYADYLFRAGDYQASLDKAQAMAAGNCKDQPRLKVLFAYNYDRLGDTMNARKNILEYLGKTAADKIQNDDYLLAANVVKKIPGRETEAINYLQTALKNDTIKTNQYMYMDTIASLYKRLGEFDQRLQWLQKSFATNPAPSNLDIYNIGDAAYQVGKYPLADSMFTLYSSKYPDQIYGYLGTAKTAIALDKDTTTGSAIPQVRSLIAAAERINVDQNRSTIIQNLAYLVYVQANVKKDYAGALKDLEHILEIDPENSYAKQTADQIRKVMGAGRSTSSSRK